MPRSCKCILDTMVHKGAMTKEERDKIVRNLKTQNEGSKTMGKLIDVDAFKARLSAGLVYQGADVLEALDEQPAIEERPGKWIPVTERLPVANGRYLVTRGLNACGALWNRMYIINYSDLMGIKSERIWWDGNVGKSDFEVITDVIAWMPLPKTYMEGADNGTD